MAYSTTILDVINNVSGWETTLEAEYDEYTQEQRRFTDLMVLRRSAPLNFSHEVVTTTNVITAAENGKTFYLALAAGFTSTLPAAALGLEYNFIVQIAPTGAKYIILADTADTIVGTVLASSGGSEDVESTAGADQISFVHTAGAAKIGDMVKVWSDGTLWYATGVSATASAILFEG